MKEDMNKDTSNNVSLTGEEWEQKINYEQRKGFHPFYIFPLMYVVSLYLFPFFSYIGQKSSVLSYSVYLPIVFGILNIVVSIVFCKPENRIMMLNAAVLVKYTMIPFFVIGGIVVILSFFLSFIPVPFMIFLGPMIATIGVVGGWIILVFESPYVISYLHLSSKTKIRPSFMTILHILLQFFFLIDVLDVMFLTLREGKWKKITIGIVLLSAICIAILLIRIVLGIFGILSN